MTMASHTDGIDALPRYVRDPVRTPAERLALNNQIESARMDAMRAKYGPAKLLSRDLTKDVTNVTKGRTKATSLDQIKKAVQAGKVLHADIPSTCFSDLAFYPDPDDPTTGTIVGTFYHGGSLTYEGDADLDEFLDAVASGSLGGAYADDKWF